MQGEQGQTYTSAAPSGGRRMSALTGGPLRRSGGSLAGVVAACALLAGCGGGTKTVSVSSAPVLPSTTSAAATHTDTTARTNRSPPPKTTAGSGSTPVEQNAAPEHTSSTRTAPEPAFAEHGGTSAGETGGAEAMAAVAVVKNRGYTPNDTAEYHPDQTLRVLVGTRNGATAGYNEQAFFFVDGRYIGTDSSEPSASIRVVSQSDTEVAIAYALYRPHDTMCCPSGGETTVHFQLNNGQLMPAQPIPPAHSASSLSRL